MGDAAPPATVHLVPTLHQYHLAAPCYGFDALTGVLEALRPDVLLCELTERALRERRPQVVRQEYQHSVFPYLARHGIAAVAMEPGGELLDELVTRGLEAEQQFKDLAPARHADHERSAREMLGRLLRSWDSPAAVDSARTDRVFAEKHALEHELFGAAYRENWNRWNEHFAQTIGRTAQAHPGRRLVALAGVEHGYWLRRRLRELGAAAGTWTLAPRLDGRD